MSDAKMTLAHKKNLKDFEEKKKEQLAKVKQVTGVDYEFGTELPIEEFVVKLIKGNAKYHETVGRWLYGEGSYLSIALELLTKQCKDDMVKEAIVDATPSKKILVCLADEYPKDVVQFKNGALCLYTSPEYFAYRLGSDYTDYDVTKLL